MEDQAHPLLTSMLAIAGSTSRKQIDRLLPLLSEITADGSPRLPYTSAVTLFALALLSNQTELIPGAIKLLYRSVQYDPSEEELEAAVKVVKSKYSEQAQKEASEKMKDMAKFFATYRGNP